jgi:hypothetical protein
MALGKLSPPGDPAPNEPKWFAAVVQYKEAAPVNSHAPSKKRSTKASTITSIWLAWPGDLKRTK